MARPINEYFAPIEDIRPTETGAAALERAGYRVGRSYQEVARNIEAQGRGAAGQIKASIWPADIGKLEAASEKTKAAAKGEGINVRFSNIGGVNGEGLGTHRGHAQISRGAGILGRSLADGGYGLAAGTGSGSSSEEYANSDGTSGVEYQDASAANKAQAAAAAYNGIGVGYEGVDSKGNAVYGSSALDQSANKATADLAGYWTKYYGSYQGIPTGETDASGNVLGIDQYGNPSSSQVSQNKGYIASDVAALGDYVNATAESTGF